MSRIARLKVKGERAVYHIMSRTVLKEFVIGDVEKDFFLKHIKRVSSAYFVDVLGFCIMGNHFHLVIEMHTEDKYSDEEVRKRYRNYYNPKGDADLSAEYIPKYKKRWSNLSNYAKDIKQGFSFYINKRLNRKGFFWGERFKSNIIEKGETLINCLAYVDLNPIRAFMVEQPEDYRWCSIGYHMQTGNKDNFLSTDFGLKEFGVKEEDDRLAHYRSYMYGRLLPSFKAYQKQKAKDKLRNVEKPVVTTGTEKIIFRTRYFIDSGIIGSKSFVSTKYLNFKNHFHSKHDKKARPIKGLNGIYSLKRLSEKI